MPLIPQTESSVSPAIILGGAPNPPQRHPQPSLNVKLIELNFVFVTIAVISASAVSLNEDINESLHEHFTVSFE